MYYKLFTQRGNPGAELVVSQKFELQMKLTAPL
jgi:hypothetical protein